jgi:transcription antitermination factor NusG
VWAGREHLSAQHLRQRGYEIFLPCYRDHRRWSDRVKTIERALFAGYVFCRLQMPAVAKIVTAPGVIRIVGDREGPVPVPAPEIEALQRIVATRLAAEPWEMVDVGQRVRVEVGPLRGMEGVVLMVKNRHRLVVSIPLLQRAVAVEMEPDWISVPPAALAWH